MPLNRVSVETLICVYIMMSNTCWVVFLLCLSCLRLVPYVAIFSGLFIFDYPFVLCTLCCHILWIVHFWLPLRYSLTFIYTLLLYTLLFPYHSIFLVICISPIYHTWLNTLFYFPATFPYIIILCTLTSIQYLCWTGNMFIIN